MLIEINLGERVLIENEKPNLKKKWYKMEKIIKRHLKCMDPECKSSSNQKLNK